MNLKIWDLKNYFEEFELRKKLNVGGYINQVKNIYTNS